MSVADILLVIANSSDPDKLTGVLERFLPTLITKLAESDEEARNEIMDVLRHVTQRVKSNQSVRLPLTALQRIAAESSDPFALNFSLLYLRIGVPRLRHEERVALLPFLLETTTRCQAAQRPGIGGCLLTVIASLPPDYTLTQVLDSASQATLLSLGVSTLLLPYSPTEGDCPGGVSPAFIELFKQSDLDGNQLETLKLRFLALLPAADWLSGLALAPLYAAAQADARATVSGEAENALKRRILGVNWTEAVPALTELYLGEPASKTPDSDRKRPSNLRQRLKILPLLLRSSQLPPQLAVRIIYSSLNDTGDDIVNVRYQQLVLQLVHHFVSAADAGSLGPLAGIILSLLTKLVTDDRFRNNLPSVLTAIGKLVSLNAWLLKTRLDTIKMLLGMLESEESAAEQALSLVALAAGKLPHDEAATLLSWLAPLLLTPKSSREQLVALRFALKVFPRTHLAAVHLLLRSADLGSESVRAETEKHLLFSPDNKSSEAGSFQDVISALAGLQLTGAGQALLLRFLRQSLLLDAGVPLCDELEKPKVKLADHISTVSESSLAQYAALCERLGSSSTDPVAVFCCAELLALAPSAAKLTSYTWLKGALLSRHPGTVILAAEAISRAAALANDIPTETTAPVSQLLAACNLQRLAENSDLQDASISSFISDEALRLLSELQPMAPSRLVCDAVCRVLPLLGDISIEKLPSKWFTANAIEGRRHILQTYVLCAALSSWQEEWIVEESPPDEGVGKDKENTSSTTATTTITAAQATVTAASELVVTRDIDLILDLGEALVCLPLGLCSEALVDPWNGQSPHVPELYRDAVDKRLATYIQLLQRDYTSSSRPLTQLQGGVWLYLAARAALQHSPSTPLKSLQKSFIRLLTSGDELTRGVAAEGLSLLRNSGLQLDDIDEILPLGSEGHSLTAQRELVGLARDLKQPQLAYRFLQLANHQTAWAGRLSVSAEALGDELWEKLQPVLEEVLPRLYRYQFDPSNEVRAAMKEVWKALTAVRSARSLLIAHSKRIIIALVKTLPSREWRLRESSALAATDLISLLPPPTLLAHHAELWRGALALGDDMKESVRGAGMTLMGTLSKVTQRVANANIASADITAVLGEILDLLLQQGLLSSAQAVQALSLETLLGLAEGDMTLLRPHLPALCMSLVNALAQLEPAELNYLTVRATESNERSALEELRVAVAKGSPLMSALRRCVAGLTLDQMEELAPQLASTLRTSPALQAKVAACHVVSYIAVSPTGVPARAVSKLQAALSSALPSRSPVLRKQVASSLGQIAKLMTPVGAEKLADKAANWYTTSDDEACLDAAALAVLALQKADKLPQRALPLIFFAMHDVYVEKSTLARSAERRSTWSETWSSCVSTSEAGLRLHLDGLLALLEENDTQRHAARVQIALCLETASMLTRDFITAEQRTRLAAIVIKQLQGKVWPGKKTILSAIEGIAHNQPETRTLLLPALLLQCRKTEPAYKFAALLAAARVGGGEEEDHDLVQMTQLYAESQSFSTDRRDVQSFTKQRLLTALSLQLPLSSSERDAAYVATVNLNTLSPATLTDTLLICQRLSALKSVPEVSRLFTAAVDLAVAVLSAPSRHQATVRRNAAELLLLLLALPARVERNPAAIRELVARVAPDVDLSTQAVLFRLRDALPPTVDTTPASADSPAPMSIVGDVTSAVGDRNSAGTAAVSEEDVALSVGQEKMSDD